MSFQQSPPTLGNQYDDDRVLRSYLARVLPEAMLSEIEPSLRELGRLAGGELYQMQLADRLNEPRLTQWDAWGNRIDAVDVTPLWREAERIAVDFGVVATAYEQKHGSLSRVHQCALAYLFTPSTDIYSCPLAMTDGAARTLLSSGNQELIDRAVPHLITRNREDFWTAGQWMTELTGGSDVGLSETVARHEDGSPPSLSDDRRPSTVDRQFSWRLYGNKWFASAITSDIALTLARPEGNPPGGRGLALFYLELRDADGRLRNIQINRLKDKLGTRKVPTAELTLVGTTAQLVKGPTDGVRNIAPLLNITRLWNGISAVALMRRGLALAADYARRRTAFGAQLSDKPLHLDTLAGLQAEAEAAFHLAFYVAELTGRAETADQSPTSEIQSQLNTGSAGGSPAMSAQRENTIRGSNQAAVTQLGMSQGQEGGLAPALVSTASVSDRTDQHETLLLRLLTPVMKLTTGKQAVQVLSEVLEAFGGAGYVEDTGLPQLLRDSQVLPIWEGTTNILSLDTLRALGVGRPKSDPGSATSDIQSPLNTGSAGGSPAMSAQRENTIVSSDHSAVTPAGMSQGQEGGLAPAPAIAFQAFKSAVSNCLSEARDSRLTDPIRITRSALAHAETWASQTNQADPLALEAAARRFAMTLGRTMELALLIKHAQWSQDHEADGRATAAARRFANSGIDLLVDHDLNDARALVP